MTTIRASPKLCPGYSDGSCIASGTLEYIRTWREFKSLPGVYKTDRKWLKLRYPPAEGYSAHPGWQEMLKNAARSVADLTPPYIRYLSWRFAWHLFWHHRGMRHQSAPLERMWGNVAADVLLWHFRLLQDHDLEVLYSMSVGSLLGLLACRWDYGIAVLEMFYAIRQDLDKHSFNPLKSAVQRADTAMRWYIKAINKDEEEQRYQRMLLSSAFRVLNNMLRVYATERQCRVFAKLYCRPPPIPRDFFVIFSRDQFGKEMEQESGQLERERADKSIKWLVHHIAEHEAIHGKIEPKGTTAPHDRHMSCVNAVESWYGHAFIEELAESLQERERSEKSGHLSDSVSLVE
ncbi:uncharacterized protein LY79DRAFT_537418 [Colletotrichum navitas]|uniref:Uncharacterized protein n=1 Tax=Colletotrichum navitas TaxID=681940 RepID=A0AAD8Q9R4_9PEZI|nr:uncharacterized protein LY79DRAFT_537418 [Colletotrichum navitas]KAK1598537.1 hypothetical protein LY79DRAFT_537418 [Colletotrichum navitas]